MRLKNSLFKNLFNVERQDETLQKRIIGTEIALLIIFFVCLINSLWAISGGWNNPLLGIHDFRQTQTAISTFYLLKGSSWLAYETPVLGLPWSIPMEFPLYQGIVASLVKLFNTPIDQTGRFVSALFFYLSLIPFYGILSCLKISKPYRWIFLSLFLASPLYLFWSRTFMIESIALFFSLAYLSCVGFYLRKQLLLFAGLASLLGIVGGLIKITTLVAFIIPALVWVIVNWFKRDRSRNVLKDLIIPLVAFLILPYLATKIWVDFADTQKMLNPLASDYITSTALRNWNFGTIHQKLSLPKWSFYLNRTLRDVFGGSLSIMSFLVLVFLSFLTRRKLFSFGSVFLFLAPVAIFTNLHFRHNYYPYANAVFLICAVGFTLTGLMEQKRYTVKYFGLFLLILVLLFQVRFFYRNTWNSMTRLTNHKSPLQEVAYQAKKLTSPDGVLLIYGQNWSSVIPYYSQRRALMFSDTATDEKLEIARNTLSKANYKIEAMIFCNQAQKALERKKYLTNLSGFRGKVVFSNSQCDIYLPKGL